LALKEKPLEEVTRNTLVALREFGGSSLPRDDVTLIGIEFKE
jgi:serine phosphatase RsbU (regulator of sigma subunit)